MRIVAETPADLEAYGSVPIAFTISSRVDLEALLATGAIVEAPVLPREKDYDLFEDERPVCRGHLDPLGVFGAFEGLRRLGGAIVACSVPGYDLAEDTAVLLDLRVDPALRGQGVGRGLFLACVDWARSRGCAELVVETQDTNVGACRFYARMGCRLVSVDSDAYGPGLDEVRLIWALAV